MPRAACSVSAALLLGAGIAAAARAAHRVCVRCDAPDARRLARCVTQATGLRGRGATGRLWWCWQTSQRQSWTQPCTRCCGEACSAGLRSWHVSAAAAGAMPRARSHGHRVLRAACVCAGACHSDRGLQLEVHTREGNPFKLSDLRKARPVTCHATSTSNAATAALPCPVCSHQHRSVLPCLHAAALHACMLAGGCKQGVCRDRAAPGDTRACC